MQKRVTLSLDADSYKRFQKYCDDNDIIVSKKIERIMNEYLDNQQKNRGGRS